MCIYYVSDLFFYVLLLAPVSISMSGYIRCSINIYWTNEWMNKCLNVIPHSTKRCQYWNIAIGTFLVKCIHSLSLAKIGPWPARNHTKSPGEATQPPANQGDHHRLVGCPINLTEDLTGFLPHLSSSASVLLCVFLETKIGTHPLTSASVTLEAEGKNIWNWGFLRTLGKAAAFPQPASCLHSAHTSSVWCVNMGHPFWGILFPVLLIRGQVSPHPLSLYFCHELVSCVLWHFEPGTLKSIVSFKISHLP